MPIHPLFDDKRLHGMMSDKYRSKAMEKIEHILVVSRMSQYCREAVQIGISLAKKYGSDLQVLHLISNPVNMEALNAPVPFPDGSHKTYASIQEETKEELDKILRKEISSGLPIKIIIKDGKPVDEIVKVVKEDKIDLMVLLAHEEGRLEHLLFGQDNDDIIRRMPCTILLVKKEPEPVIW
jgi:nucleotide-binding universal stress UspA family protein